MRPETLARGPPPRTGGAARTRPTVKRLDLLRAIPAEVRFVSFEPLIGPVEARLHSVDWAIVGGESAPRVADARPMREDWVRGLRDACAASGTAFFFKQWGTWAAREVGLRGKGGKDDALLDGVRWREFPVGPAEGRREIARLRAALAGREAEAALLRRGMTGPANAARDRRAAERARNALPHVSALLAERPGLDNQALARALTAKGVPTPGGAAHWHRTQVARVRRRAGG
jgi:hypothetical protein